jgi:hypothetical protein
MLELLVERVETQLLVQMELVRAQVVEVETMV